MLENNFYDKIEEKGKLKHVLYGDSVAEYCTTLVQWKNETKVSYIEFNQLWDKLIENGASIEYIDGKEYIFFTEELKTVGYNVKDDKLLLTIPKYLMRHKIEKDIFRIKLINNTFIDATKDHSMLDYDHNKRELIKKKADELAYLLAIRDQFDCEGTSSSNSNQQITRKESLANLHNIKTIKIQEIIDIEYSGYVYDFEIPNLHNFVANGILVHNTDSIFVTIPVKNAQNLTLMEKWKIASDCANGINDLIVKYNRDFLLPRCNISPERNQTFFKTEFVMDSAMFLEIKKNYAYLAILKEGDPIENPKVKYTGIPVVKSDATKMTQMLLKEMIEKVMLNTSIEDNLKLGHISNIVTKYKTLFDETIKNYKFEDIGIPGKWAKKSHIINGMKLYNFIMGTEVFSIGSAGKIIYTNFHNPNLLKGLDLNDTKCICIPYIYNHDEIKEKMTKFAIYPNKEEQWSKIFSTACQNIVELAKKIKYK